VLRTIPQKIPNFEELGLPPVLTEIACPSAAW
jgi:twitching motility protein PilU